MTLRTVALAALLLAPASALADEEQDDKLCEVIGEAPNISVPRRTGCGSRRTAAARVRPAAGSWGR